MRTYFESNNKVDCNGCGVCALKCPKKAITMETDTEGFLYPVIDKKKCINCGLCQKVCPNKDYKNINNSKCYLSINNNKSDLLNSSSGGMFILLAKYIIKQKGIVFGAKYNKNLIVEHDYTKNLEGLKEFQGSKYVRSNLKNSYEKVKEFLNQNKYVLFTGTPCQCQGLRSYLGKSYDKLVTCEIICHANPSPKIFEYYKKNLEILKKEKIAKIEFRSKKNGWKTSKTLITYENGETIEDVTFYKGFIAELFNRPSCHKCHFCTQNRLSDFTIGDLWGLEKIDPTIIDNDTGVSLFCVNTEQGKKIFEKIKNNLYAKEININIGFEYNHHTNVLEHKKRKKFFREINNQKINETNIIDAIEKYAKRPIYKRCLSKIKKLLNEIINKIKKSLSQKEEN